MIIAQEIAATKNEEGEYFSNATLAEAAEHFFNCNIQIIEPKSATFM